MRSLLVHLVSFVVVVVVVVVSVAVVPVTAAKEEEVCGLYLAPSALDPGTLTLYAGKDYTKRNKVGEDELLLPIIDANKNEYSPWHDFIWDEHIVPEELLPDALYLSDVFVSGLGSMSSCSSQPNIEAGSKVFLGSHVFGDTAGGAVSDFHNFAYHATTDLEAGEMLFMNCEESDDYEEQEKVVKPLDELQSSGACVDALSVRESTVVGAGRGAFSKFAVAKGDVITTSPMIHFDRSQTEMVSQLYKEDHLIPLFRDHGIEYTSKVTGQQLVLNYCYGDEDSNVLLLPFSPGVNFINHDETPNAYIRWSTTFADSTVLRETKPVMELFELGAGALVVEYVALEEIRPGDEIFIDYGSSFAQALKEHSKESKAEKATDSSCQPFRHEIRVLRDFFPANWRRADPNPYGDFIASPLAPGHMAPIRWQNGAEVVTPWAFRLGLHNRVGNVLREYCDKMGITEIMQHVTVEGNGLEAGTESHMDLEGDDWYLQRPDPKWRSNLHWFSPGASAAHEHYLQALSHAGFDEILDGIGKYLGMDGLVAFHVTFIAVSFSNRGYLHYDTVNTGAKVYNVIIPLILANETGPELDLQSWHPDLNDDQELEVGRYRYELNYASMMGDNAVHATSSCDYRNTKEMRMAATVYIADVNDENIESVMQHYTQAYPPGDDVDLLRSWMAKHWKKDDPSRSLPKPSADHILVRGAPPSRLHETGPATPVTRESAMNTAASRKAAQGPAVLLDESDGPTEEL